MPRSSKYAQNISNSDTVGRPVQSTIAMTGVQAVAHRQRGDLVAPAELAHDRQRLEHVDEVVVVGDAGRGLGVVLDVAQAVGEEPVEPRGGRGGAARRLGQRQALLLGVEVELGPQVRVAQQRPLERLQRAVQALGDVDRGRVLLALEELRADRDRQRVLAEHEPALGLAVAQQLAALGGQVLVLEQRVVGGDRLGLQPAALALADPDGHLAVSPH
jgi:hypothetical protein